MPPLRSIEIFTPKPHEKKISFVVVGDMPYHPTDKKRFSRLTQAINRKEPTFVAHVGDLKPGKKSCKKDIYLWFRKQAQKIECPVIYTPGDNDWADCRKKKGGQFGADGALNFIRKTFFQGNTTLGGKPQVVTQQSQCHKHFSSMGENVSFQVGGILFLTIHTVCGEGQLQLRSPHQTRNKANVAWLKACAAYAREKTCRGMVIMTHANLQYYATPKRRMGFSDIHTTLGRVIKDFPKPILLCQGDKHEFVIDNPPILPSFPEGHERLTRVQVMGGEKTVHGVVVTVNQDRSELFSIRSLIIPQNMSKEGKLSQA